MGRLMRYCTQCGAECAGADRYCARCGTDLDGGRSSAASAGPAYGTGSPSGSRPPYGGPSHAGPTYSDPAYSTPAAATDNTAGRYSCLACGAPWQGGMSCVDCGQVWGQPIGIRLAPVARRFGEAVLEAVLMVVTLFIGWVIWACVVFARGQTPAKQVLGLRVVKRSTGQAAGWGTMFLREVIAKGVIGAVVRFTFIGVILDFWLLWDKDRQELWDKMSDTLVVNDPGGTTLGH